ncbi:hypothetical protein C8R44DRAFT_795892 [Mycena epipterygia]|nr:hypothetical protein C8R44DRAFT_795892 [Mycena epipterygia]
MLLVCASCCASHSGNHQARFGVGTVVYTGECIASLTYRFLMAPVPVPSSFAWKPQAGAGLHTVPWAECAGPDPRSLVIISDDEVSLSLP